MRAPGAAGPRVRELMAEPRVGRLRTVRLQGISARVLFLKVRNGAEGWYSIKRKGLHACLSAPFAAMSTFKPNGSQFAGDCAQKRQEILQN